MGGIGIIVGDASVGINVNLWKLDTCHTYSNTSHGFYFNSPTAGVDCNAGTAINCDASLNGGDGFKIDKALKNSFVSCTAQLNTGIGFRFTTNAIANKMFGGDQDESNTAGNITIEAGSAGNCFFGVDDLGFTDNGTSTTYVNRLNTKLNSLYLGIGTDPLTVYVKRTAFTPILQGSTTAGTQTYSVQKGYYSRIGNTITFWIQITLSAKDGTTAGNLQISGLPASFTNLGITAGVNINSCDLVSIGAGYRPGAIINAGENIIRFVSLTDNASASYLSSTSVSNTSGFILTGSYFIN